MFHASFRTFRPRHPLARLLSGVVGLIAVLLLVTVGMFAFAALVVGGALFMLVNAFRSSRTQRANPAPAPSRTPPPAGVIEGDFTVVSNTRTRAPSS